MIKLLCISSFGKIKVRKNGDQNFQGFKQQKENLNHYKIKKPKLFKKLFFINCELYSLSLAKFTGNINLSTAWNELSL